MSRRPSLRHRPARTVPATVAGVVVLALGIAAGTAAVLRLSTGTWPTWASGPLGPLADSAWRSTTVIAVAVGLGVIGVVALVCAIKPGPLSSLPLRIDGISGSDREMVIGRQSVARLAAGMADLVDGVQHVTAVTGRRSVRLSVTAPAGLDHAVAASVRSAVTERVRTGLAQAGIHPLPAVRVSVRSE